MISEKRKEYLLWCWEDELTEEDEEWRDELAAEEQELVDEWDRGYAEGFVKLIGEQT